MKPSGEMRWKLAIGVAVALLIAFGLSELYRQLFPTYEPSRFYLLFLLIGLAVVGIGALAWVLLR